jgi:hypothetical protein
MRSALFHFYQLLEAVTDVDLVSLKCESGALNRQRVVLDGNAHAHAYMT